MSYINTYTGSKLNALIAVLKKTYIPVEYAKNTEAFKVNWNYAEKTG